MKQMKLPLLAFLAALWLAATAFSADQPKGVAGDTAMEIKGALGNAVESALDGDYGNLVASLSKPDRERIARAGGRDDRNMENVAEQFGDTWRNRFDDSIDLESRDAIARVFSNAQINQMDAKHAQVQIPASHNLPPITLRLSNEGMLADKWRIDAPDNLTGEALRSRVQNELQTLSNTQQNWPADRTNAEQYAAHRMLSTLSQG